MTKFFVSCLIAVILASPASARTRHQDQQQRPQGRCAQGVYVAQLKTCILHVEVRTAEQAAQAGVPDIKNDPRCEGKPDGFRYETQVPHPTKSGVMGTAHHVCGSRPN